MIASRLINPGTRYVCERPACWNGELEKAYSTFSLPWLGLLCGQSFPLGLEFTPFLLVYFTILHRSFIAALPFLGYTACVNQGLSGRGSLERTVREPVTPLYRGWIR